MKYLIVLSLIFILSNCYVYRAYEPKEDEKIPTIQEQIKNDKLYMIKAKGETYKLQAIQWEGDSLIAQINRKDDETMKFHKNDISEVNNRIFSRGRSDALTFGIYGAITAIILLLAQ